MLKGKKPSSTVTLDQRKEERRKGSARRQKQVATPVERREGERREKVNRRRQIDPTTCERDYTSEEIEFMHALDAYKRSSGRMFPTCSEVLEVLRGLGYAKVPASIAGDAAIATASKSEPSLAASAAQG